MFKKDFGVILLALEVEFVVEYKTRDLVGTCRDLGGLSV